MVHSEQPAQSNGERLSVAPELFDYKTVLNALEEYEVDHDDIAYVCDVIFDWKHAVTSWSQVEQVRTLSRSLREVSGATAHAQALLEQSGTILADEHWAIAVEIAQETNAFLEANPGVVYVVDFESHTKLLVNSVALSTEHTIGAQLFVSGDEGVVEAQSRNLQVVLDRTKLRADARQAVDAYVAALEIQPEA